MISSSSMNNIVDPNILGRRYDKNGNLQQWWTESTLQEYHNRVQCIVQQYGRYHVPQLGHNFTVRKAGTLK